VFKVGSGTLDKPKKLASKYFWKGEEAHDRNDRFVYDQSKGALYYDPDGTGAKDQIKIAQFKKNMVLKLDDLFVV